MKTLLFAFAAFALSGQLIAAPIEMPKSDSPPNRDSLEAAIFRGQIVYQNYCVLCHGIKADGVGRAAKLYTPKPSNLLLSDKTEKYKALIIRQGGKEIGRSEFMPPWKTELTEEQMSDVVSYLTSIVVPKVEAK
jgi:mono/diheme cytochrome c family protein